MIFSGVVYYSFLSKETADMEIGEMQIIEAPEECGVNKIEALWSREVLELTYEKLMKNGDLIALIEISGCGKTYLNERGSANYTLFKAKIIEVLKGDVKEGDEIVIITTGGYDPNMNVFKVIEGCPVFRKGERWLVFLLRATFTREPPLPENTYYLTPSFMGLKMVDGKLYSMDNFDEAAGYLLAECLKVKGLTLEEFKSTYIKR
jgi:hypothetical protein